ncbi:hypothetical protein [Absidia glauca]|uniref:Transketolase-like pyrimidine-binding domain-containing protein n=1 Tax=Absidia glauca TaxID=4829 RepID=A0A168R9Z7_ABSGL|nr:hypothetical protein [Absidia glauca]
MLRLHQLKSKTHRTPLLGRLQGQRLYHDNNIYGYRAPKPYAMPDYTQTELNNRMDNGSLLRMVQAYRTHGHRGAQLDPLDFMKREEVLALKPERYGLTDESKMYNISGKARVNMVCKSSWLLITGRLIFLGILHVSESKQDPSAKEEADFKTILSHLNATYCGNIAYEFMHLPSASERRWWYHAVESWNKPQLSVDEKKRIHHLLSQSESFDHFLAKKFPNLKRYGLEGAESMMVALDRLFGLSAKAGVSDLIVGMPHRGRLNLLCDLLEYPHEALFHKMKGQSELPENTFHSADVISHLTNNPDLKYDGHPLHVALLSNPSHLEAINPDIILDLMCYRRWGHNELDEPAFTQPRMYDNIRLRTSVPKLYEEKLCQEQVLTTDDITKIREQQQDALAARLKKSDDYKPSPSYHLEGNWKGIEHIVKGQSEQIDTGLDRDTLVRVGKQSVTAPEGIRVHPRLEKYHIGSRLKKLEQGTGLDWATAEALAFGSLLEEGHGIRISGQDVGRGTFSQRHAMFVCQDTEDAVIPLNEINKNNANSQGFLEVANSPLNEFAVLGFEYGMSIETPKRLVIWEAQFGDFFNGAQIALDTFVSSGEEKWLRQSGLVLLLPHGQDGAGPEHSSSRVERFLQMSNDPYNVDDAYTTPPNWHVVNCTTPAQYYHVLRRQLAVSSLEDMQTGTQFQPVLTDPTTSDPEQVDKVVFVSGKLYYDLQKEKIDRGLNDRVALIRIEELCPFPKDQIKDELDKYRYATEFVWCQEEPENAGAYGFMAPRLSQMIPHHKLEYVGRKPLSAPAIAIPPVFKAQQSNLIKDAVNMN